MPLSSVQISATNLLHNIAEFRKLLPVSTETCLPAGRLVAVVKANAYGHGLKEVVSVVENEVDLPAGRQAYFQVDDIEELRTLRVCTKKPAFVFGYVQKNDLEELVRLDAILGVYDLERIEILNKIGEERKKKIKIHLKVDALLGRQGVLLEEVEKIGQEIKKCEWIELEAVYSHFSNIEDTDNLEHARKQHGVLLEAKEILQKVGFENIVHHISATSGLLSDLETNWGGSLVRLGIGMYGLWPSVQLKEKLSGQINLCPVLKWVTKIAEIKTVPANFSIGYGLTFVTEKETRIAVIPQGYSDGFDRGFSNNAEVLIGGTRCKVLGRVAMNMFVVDVSHLAEIKVGDEVVLLGRQGNEEITAEEMAERIGTINYEIVARLSPLLPRIVVR